MARKKTRSMDPRAFLDLAKRLLEREKNPAGFRSTVSRAYYAAFNVAVEFLEGIGCGVGNGPNAHGLAYQYLNNCGDDALIEAAGDFDDLRGQRNDADYRLDRSETEKEAIVRNSVEVAEQIIEVLDDCNSSTKRKDAVTIAVQAYKAKTGR